VRTLARRVGATSTLIALVLAAGLAVSACGGDSSDSSGTSGSSGASEDPKKVMIFYYFPRSFNALSMAWANGWDAAAEELGSEVEIEHKATGKLETDASAFLSFINSALVQQPDGIIVIPNDATAMQSGLKRIAASGTKVLIQDQNPPDFPEAVSFVGTNNVKAGAQAASWVIEQAEAGKLPSDEVAILASPPGVTSVDDRVKGFEEAVKEANLKVVAKTADGCLEAAKARATMADVLTAHPNLGAVFTVCDLIATGAAQALKAAGKLDIGLVSIDASEPAVKSIINDGGIDAEVAQHGFEMSRLALETLAKAMSGEDTPEFIDSGTTLVTKENAKEYLDEVAEQLER
jgi:ribose transport system substrate-binding protein